MPNPFWDRAYRVATDLATRSAELASTVHSPLKDRLGGTGWRSEGRRPLWCHAASVGEIASLAPVVTTITERRPATDWGVTTTSTTGRTRAREALPHARFHELFPLDGSRAVTRALDRLSPAAVLIVETEIWPGFLRELKSRHIPACLASARITDEGFRSYQRWRGLFAAALDGLDLIAARTATDRDRFIALGAQPHRTIVLGNTKLDAPPAVIPSDVAERFTRFADGRPLVVWGCLRPDEVSLAVEVIGAVAAPCRWIVVPRHPSAFDAIIREVRDALPASTVRTWGEADGDAHVLVGDAMGILGGAYAAASVAVVGGTFHAYGGHNLMEPAAVGVPVVFGPDTSSWPDDAAALLDAEGGVRTRDVESTAAAIQRWLTDDDLRIAAGDRAAGAAEAGRGASARIVDTLSERGFFDQVTETSR